MQLLIFLFNAFFYRVFFPFLTFHFVVCYSTAKLCRQMLQSEFLHQSLRERSGVRRILWAGQSVRSMAAAKKGNLSSAKVVNSTESQLSYWKTSEGWSIVVRN